MSTTIMRNALCGLFTCTVPAARGITNPTVATVHVMNINYKLLGNFSLAKAWLMNSNNFM